jgi:type VI secretion system protein ImpC
MTRIELPLTIGVLADLAGNAPRSPPGPLRDREFVKIDRDSYARRLRSIAPGLSLVVRDRIAGAGQDPSRTITIELRFRSLSDFAPAAIGRQIGSLRPLDLERRRIIRMRDGATPPDAPADPDQAARRLAELNRAIGSQVAEVLDHPAFQRLEAAWRGLHYLLHEAEAGPRLKIRVLAIAKEELRADMDGAVEADRSLLFRRVYQASFSSRFRPPFGLLVGDYEFGPDAADIRLLRAIARVAALAHAPFVAAASPAMFGQGTYSGLAGVRDPSRVFERPEFAAWNAFRDSEDACHVALALPRLRIRPSYGQGPVDGPGWSRDPGLEPPVPGAGGDTALWMSAAWAYAARAADSFARYGRLAATRGVEGGGLIEGLPMWRLRTAQDDVRGASPVEVAISGRQESKLSRLGFMPVASGHGLRSAVFLSNRSCHRPATYPQPEVQADAELAAEFGLRLDMSRYVHCVMAIVRDRQDEFIEPGRLEAALTAWIKDCVGPVTAATPGATIEPMLDKARIEFRAVSGMLGAYDVRLRLRPHGWSGTFSASVMFFKAGPRPGSWSDFVLELEASGEFEATPPKPGDSDVATADSELSGINLGRSSDSGISLRGAAVLGLGQDDSIELAPLSAQEIPTAEAKPSPAKRSLSATPPPAVKKGEKDIFDDTDFEMDVLPSDDDSDDKTVQLEAASDFDLEESDSASEVFAIDEEAVDQNAATAMAPAAFAEDDEWDDGFNVTVSSEMASPWSSSEVPTAAAERSGPVTVPVLGGPRRRRPWLERVWGWLARKLTIKQETAPTVTEPVPPPVLRRHTDVSFPARVRLGKPYHLRVRLVPAEEELPGGGTRERPRPHTHDATVNLLMAPPPRRGAPPPPIRVAVSLAAENFEIDGPNRAELVVPKAGASPAVQFRLRGLSLGPGRVMVDFTQDGRPVGSVDLAPDVVADAEAERSRGRLAPAVGSVDLSVDPRRKPAPPDLVLKVFEHRLSGHPGRLQFVLSSTKRALRDLPVLDGDLGTLDLKSEVAAWVDAQLRAFGSLAEQPDTTADDVARALGDVGCNLYRQLLPPALQDLCWTFRQRGVKTVMILSDEPYIPWELIKPFRADPATGAVLAEDGFWGEVFALTHWLRGRPPAPRLSVQRVVALAPGSRRFAPDPGSDPSPLAGAADSGPGPTRDMAVTARALAEGSSKSAPGLGPIPHLAGALANLSHPALADEELELLRVLESLGARIDRLPAQRKALRRLLEQGDFDLLHLVSHGDFGGTMIADASGVRLEDGVFTAAELSQRMAGPIRRRSPLVFFNTCHSGRVGYSLTCLGAWGARFVQMGCGGFVGALWPVTERAALAFARAFYEAIARGCPIGDAVRIARQRVRERFPDDPTWLAYRCFADPMARVEPLPGANSVTH